VFLTSRGPNGKTNPVRLFPVFVAVFFLRQRLKPVVVMYDDV